MGLPVVPVSCPTDRDSFYDGEFMKTERRHELQTNELADWLGTKTKQIRPYARVIVGILVLTSAAIFLLSFGAVQRKKTRESAWKNLFALQVEANSSFDPLARSDYAQQLIDLSKQHEGSPVGAWALQSAGDINLALGSDLLWRDRDAAREKFQLALENYNGALAASEHDMLRQRSLQGLAQANEALNQLADAEGTYQQIIDKWPGTAVAKAASERLAFLQRPSTGQFYDWFMRQKPIPPSLPTGTPGQPPLDALPTSPNLSLPNPDDLTRPGETIAPFSVVAPESSSQPVDNESDATDVSSGGDFEIAPAEDDEPTPTAGERNAANGGVAPQADENAEDIDPSADDNGE